LAARLDRLAKVKPLAQLCATLGREFSYPLLKAVSAVDDASLQRSLARLVHAEFLHQRGTSSEAVYIFKHAMIQEAAYQSLLKSRRQQYHARIARVIVEQFASEAEAHPEVVALHHTRAGDIDAAVSGWQKAGQHAFRRASYAEAIAHYSNGLRTLESSPDERRRDQSELALRVDLGYSLIPLRGWGAPETAQAFSRAGELCRQIGDTPSQFRALWGLGAFHFVRGDQHKQKPPYKIADSWVKARGAVNPTTQFNFVSTNDIVGGNSGSPVINAKGELVGLIFDGNIQSLPGYFIYDEAVNRAVSVESRVILEALRAVYKASWIADELAGAAAVRTAAR